MGRRSGSKMRKSGDRPAGAVHARRYRAGSRGRSLTMRINVSGLAACCLLFSACLSAAQSQGKVVDSSGAAIAGAQVSAVSRTGVEAQTASSADGSFTLNGPNGDDGRIVVTARGFSTRTVPPD